uniref:Uncharacterized protein n=1 Tax=Arundo donax TaxID=35708 RepID=A0A0A9BUL5_ARUDO
MDLLVNSVRLYALNNKVKTFKHYLKDDYNRLSENLCSFISVLCNDHPRNSETGRSFNVCWRCLNWSKFFMISSMLVVAVIYGQLNCLRAK